MSMATDIRNGFLKFFGDIKIFKFPFFLLYDPGSYLVKGKDIRRVIELIQPGDILLRGYKNYLDGYFIPGFFSHAGLYLGETRKENSVIPEGAESEFYEGKQVVIHSMAEGVFMEDIINFCKCDYLIILRRSTQIEKKEEIDRSFREVYLAALSHLGAEYDFEFNFYDIHNLSCTELVYVCYKPFMERYNVKMKTRRVLLATREMLIPDDFVTDKFTIAFKSESVSDSRIANIIANNSQS